VQASVLAALAASGAWAQVGAPVLGLLPDNGHLRPVYGIPAAAAIAPALDYGVEFSLVSVAAEGGFAVASEAGSGAVVLASADGSLAPLAGAAPHPDSIVLSPRGSSAALWFASTHRLQVVSGLPGAPTVRELDASFLGASPAALAVGDDGEWAAGSWPDGAWAFGPNGEVTRLPLRERAAALAFYSGRHDVAVATHLHVFSIAGVGAADTTTVLYDGPLNPAGIAVSSSNQQVVVAGTSGQILVLDAGVSSTGHFYCGCAPEGVFAMGPASFRLTGLHGGTFKLFDAAAGDVFLVPLAPRVESQP
jgi:hypothetical protein